MFLISSKLASTPENKDGPATPLRLSLVRPNAYSLVGGLED